MEHTVIGTFKVVMTEETYQDWLNGNAVETIVKELKDEFLEDKDNFVSLDVKFEVDGVTF